MEGDVIKTIATMKVQLSRNTIDPSWKLGLDKAEALKQTNPVVYLFIIALLKMVDIFYAIYHYLTPALSRPPYYNRVLCLNKGEPLIQ